MNLEAISAIAEISGLLIIVVSLLFISAQTKQANEHASASSEISFLDGLNKILESWTFDDHTSDVLRRGFSSFNTLNKSEQSLFHTRIGVLVNHLLLARNLNSRSLLSDEVAEEMEKLVVSVLSTDGGLEYWEYDYKLTPSGEEILNLVRESKGKVPNFTDILPWWRNA